jgi:hypothetical protein
LGTSLVIPVTEWNDWRVLKKQEEVVRFVFGDLPYDEIAHIIMIVSPTPDHPVLVGQEFCAKSLEARPFGEREYAGEDPRGNIRVRAYMITNLVPLQEQLLSKHDQKIWVQADVTEPELEVLGIFLKDQRFGGLRRPRVVQS